MNHFFFFLFFSHTNYSQAKLPKLPEPNQKKVYTTSQQQQHKGRTTGQCELCPSRQSIKARKKEEKEEKTAAAVFSATKSAVVTNQPTSTSTELSDISKFCSNIFVCLFFKPPKKLQQLQTLRRGERVQVNKISERKRRGKSGEKNQCSSR